MKKEERGRTGGRRRRSKRRYSGKIEKKAVLRCYWGTRAGGAASTANNGHPEAQALINYS
jgi:hypothetical protein